MNNIELKIHRKVFKDNPNLLKKYRFLIYADYASLSIAERLAHLLTNATYDVEPLTKGLPEVKWKRICKGIPIK